MNSTVLITGASAGIGRALAFAFAARGFSLVLVARNEKNLRLLQNELAGTQTTVLSCDLTKPDAPAKLFRRTIELKLVIDILINNAGYGSRGNFTGLPLQRETGQIELNIRALTELSHLFGSKMALRKHGAILNVASVAGFMPGPYMATYYATKAFVLSFSEGLHEELRTNGVHVAVLCPGRTESDFARNAGFESGGKSPSRLMPMASAASVADYACRKFLAGKTVIIPGRLNRVIVSVLNFLPRIVRRKLTGRWNFRKS